MIYIYAMFLPNGMAWYGKTKPSYESNWLLPLFIPKKTESSERLLIWSAAYPILHFTLAHEHLPIGME